MFYLDNFHSGTRGQIVVIGKLFIAATAERCTLKGVSLRVKEGEGVQGGFTF